MQKGRLLAQKALASGPLVLLSSEEIDDDALLITCSAVGAPAAKQALALPETTTRVIELLELGGVRKAGGLITNENGGGSTFNGWLPAAMAGLPLVDLPCNGRAHPTGTMGSMALHRDKGYLSYQAAAGGDPSKGMYLESLFIGAMGSTAALVRQSAVFAGGLVSVARNPVKAAYAKKFGAPGAITAAIELGEKMLASRGGVSAARAAADHLGGKVVAEGIVERIELVTEGGFDHGTVTLAGVELTFWNEFMTLEASGKRIATFPDLIMAVDAESGLPVTTAELVHGQNIVVVAAPARNLSLGAGMFCKELLDPIEKIVNRPVVEYLKIVHPYL